MMPDMKFGWRPEVKCSHPPIPLYFDFVEHRLDSYTFEEGRDVLVYQEPRFSDTYKMHKKYANKPLLNGTSSYKFQFPKNHEGARFNHEGLLTQIFGAKEVGPQDEAEFDGMNPLCAEVNSRIPSEEEAEFL